MLASAPWKPQFVFHLYVSASPELAFGMVFIDQFSLKGITLTAWVHSVQTTLKPSRLTASVDLIYGFLLQIFGICYKAISCHIVSISKFIHEASGKNCVYWVRWVVCRTFRNPLLHPYVGILGAGLVLLLCTVLQLIPMWSHSTVISVPMTQ